MNAPLIQTVQSTPEAVAHHDAGAKHLFQGGAL